MRVDYNKRALSNKGRNGDKYMAHVAEGELIVPPVISDDTRSRVMAEMEAAGLPPAEHTVGNEMSINPETGLPEFGFLKKLAGFVLPNLGFAGGFTNGLIQGDGLGGALKQGVGSGLQTAASIYGGPLAGAAAGGVNASLNGGNPLYGAIGGGISGAFTGGGLGNLNDQLSGALGKLGDYTGLSSIYNDASGALGSARDAIGNSINDLYQGSGVQSAFNSGSDALKSFGLGSGSTSTSVAPVGGGNSSYGPLASDGFGNGVVRNTASSSLNSIPSEISNLSDITTNKLGLGDSLAKGGNVASSNYLSPLASIGIGSISNNSAQNALLKQANANKALLAPYQNFQFNPGDLTQDPGYQFNVAQGDRALSRRQNATGNYFSGAALKEAQDYGQGLADNTYNQAFNRALTTNQTGYNNALGLAGINDSIGNIKASGAINQGNLFSGALGNILGGNSYTNSGALQGGTDMQALLRRLRLA